MSAATQTNNVLSYGLMAVLCVFLARLGWSAFRSFRAKRWLPGSFSIGLILLLLYGGLTLQVLPGAAPAYRYQLTRALFGKGFYLSAPTHTFAQGSFNEGHSIEVFRISEELARWFTASTRELAYGYPKKTAQQVEWTQVSWTATPVSGEARRLLDVYLDETATEAGNKDARNLLKKLAAEPGHSGACFHSQRDSVFGNIDLFLVSPKGRILIVMRLNT